MLLSGLQNLPEDVVGRSCEKYFVYIDATIKKCLSQIACIQWSIENKILLFAASLVNAK